MALTESHDTDRLTRGPLASFAAQLRAWLADRSHSSIAQRVAGAAFLIRVVSAALIYASQVLFARWMGSFEFGIYVYVWTWVLLIGDLTDFGLGASAQRFIPEYIKRNANDLLRGFISRSRWIVVCGAIGVAVASAMVVRLVEPFLASYLVMPLTIACITLPFYGLLQMHDGIARSYNWIHIALVPPYIIRHAVMLALVAAAYLLKFPTDAMTAIYALAASFAITVVVQAAVINRRLKRTIETGPKATETTTWFKISLPILMMQAFFLLLSNTDILVLEQFRTPDDVGVYYAATKTLTLVAFVHFAVSAAVAHRFTEYHVAKDRTRLAEFLADSIRWTFWASLAATVVILAMGRLLLSLFGPRFAEGYHLMFILTIGLLARAAIGPVERLLSMVDQQRVCAAVYATAFAINLVLCILLIPRMGMVGAAISTSTALVAETVMLFWVTRARLGLHVFIWGRKALR